MGHEAGDVVDDREVLRQADLYAFSAGFFSSSSSLRASCFVSLLRVRPFARNAFCTTHLIAHRIPHAR